MIVTFIMGQMRTSERFYDTREVKGLAINNFETDDGVWFQSQDDCLFAFVIGGVDVARRVIEQSNIDCGIEDENDFEMTQDAVVFDEYENFNKLVIT